MTERADPVVAHPLRALDYLVVAWLTLLTMASAAMAVFFLPQYSGSVPVPVSALAGAAVLFWTVRAAYRITASMRAAFAPAVGWLVTSIVLSLYRTLGYHLVIGDWRSMLLLGLGALAGAVSLSVCWGWHLMEPTVPRVTAGQGPSAQ